MEGKSSTRVKCYRVLLFNFDHLLLLRGTKKSRVYKMLWWQQQNWLLYPLAFKLPTAFWCRNCPFNHHLYYGSPLPFYLHLSPLPPPFFMTQSRCCIHANVSFPIFLLLTNNPSITWLPKISSTSFESSTTWHEVTWFVQLYSRHYLTFRIKVFKLNQV